MTITAVLPTFNRLTALRANLHNVLALDGVEATWLDDGDKRELRARVERGATELTAELDPPR